MNHKAIQLNSIVSGSFDPQKRIQCLFSVPGFRSKHDLLYTFFHMIHPIPFLLLFFFDFLQNAIDLFDAFFICTALFEQ